MKVFGYYIQNSGNWSNPEEATSWDSIASAKREFSSFCDTAFNYSTEPCELVLYRGQATGDESKYGYPDYPNIMFTGYEGKDGWPVIRKEIV